MSSVARTPVLVLNSSYEPINICGAKRALALVVKGTARVEDSLERTVRVGFHMPSVIRLVEYKHIPVRQHPLSRKGIFVRDRYLCQYCTKKLAGEDMTLDHVLPRSRGGKDIWENLVACCKRCNRLKGDRLPSECEPAMVLLHKPRATNIHTSRSIMRSMGGDVPAWRKYLYYESAA